jgi:hypothetical protein
MKINETKWQPSSNLDSRVTHKTVAVSNTPVQSPALLYHVRQTLNASDTPSGVHR